MKVLRAEHVAAAADPGGFPAGRLPEIAFLGRSNVGKSSLLNRLAGRRALARVSATPGKTRLAHFYRLEGSRDSVLFVDLPGYGWARVSKSERAGWRRLVEGYLGDRAPLRGAVLLQDLRRDLSEDETLLLAWLAERRIPALLAVTKADKLPPMRRAERVRALAGAAGLPLGHVLATSARTGDGIPELWRVIEAWVRAPAGRHEEAGQR